MTHRYVRGDMADRYVRSDAHPFPDLRAHVDSTISKDETADGKAKEEEMLRRLGTLIESATQSKVAEAEYRQQRRHDYPSPPRRRRYRSPDYPDYETNNSTREHSPRRYSEREVSPRRRRSIDRVISPRGRRLYPTTIIQHSNPLKPVGKSREEAQQHLGRQTWARIASEATNHKRRAQPMPPKDSMHGTQVRTKETSRDSDGRKHDFSEQLLSRASTALSKAGVSCVSTEQPNLQASTMQLMPVDGTDRSWQSTPSSDAETMKDTLQIECNRLNAEGWSDTPAQSCAGSSHTGQELNRSSSKCHRSSKTKSRLPMPTGKRAAGDLAGGRAFNRRSCGQSNRPSDRAYPLSSPHAEPAVGQAQHPISRDSDVKTTPTTESSIFNEKLVSRLVLDKLQIHYSIFSTTPGSIHVHQSLSSQQLISIIRMTEIVNLAETQKDQDIAKLISTLVGTNEEELDTFADLMEKRHNKQNEVNSSHVSGTEGSAATPLEASSGPTNGDQARLFVEPALDEKMHANALPADNRSIEACNDFVSSPVLELSESAHTANSGAQSRPASRNSPIVMYSPMMEEQVALKQDTYLPKDSNILDPHREIVKLRRQVKELTLQLDPKQQDSLPWPVLHRIQCPDASGAAVYLDQPIQVKHSSHSHLDARHRVPDEEEWELRQTDVPFVVYLDYTCTTENPANKQTGAKNRHAMRAKRNDQTDAFSKASLKPKEGVHILSKDLKLTLENVFRSNHGLEQYLPRWFLKDGLLTAPYIFHYHFKDIITQYANTLGEFYCDELLLFVSYIQDQSEEGERWADEVFEQGMVTPDLVPYMFVPGEVIIDTKSKHKTASKLLNRVRPSVASNTNVLSGPDVTSNPVLASNPNNASNPISESHEAGAWCMWRCTLEAVKFNGRFYLQNTESMIDCSDFEDEKVHIAELPMYPLRFACARDRQYLLNRGRFFFSCRERRYVLGSDGGNPNLVSESRYMIDEQTYRIMHLSHDSRDDYISVNDKSVEDEDFTIRLPATIRGFHMQEKKWHTLPIDGLRPVEWNDDSFKNLAVDSETKELVQALVTNKIEADRGTDVVTGKGTGLIILLHGGPGTGKTLTAEGVAEIAQKPLYRVTCGDVGTQPKEVEKYLESVFQLGKTWDCVVLLDEAEVFLEERTTHSLERNALVSIFLRVLEYYDGILLLTTNRVGTFDEAFRSRIQLALHYEALNKQQRSQIWNNFIQRLEDLNEDMDFDAVRSRIGDLARWEMNGRQIRNAVTTARQVAKFRKERIEYHHLEKVIRICKKFDDYLVDVKEGKEVKNQPMEEVMARELLIR